jgi:WD40 repeat protein
MTNDDIASAGGDAVVKIWSIDGLLKKNLIGHKGNVYSLLALENNLLASGSGDGTIRIWDLDKSDSLRILNGHRDWFRSLSLQLVIWLAQVKTILSIKIWNPSNGLLIRTIDGRTDVLRCILELDLNLVSGGGFGLKSINVWNSNDGSLKKSLLGHEGPTYALLSLPNNHLASAGYDNKIIIWKLV